MLKEPDRQEIVEAMKKDVQPMFDEEIWGKVSREEMQLSMWMIA